MHVCVQSEVSVWDCMRAIGSQKSSILSAGRESSKSNKQTNSINTELEQNTVFADSVCVCIYCKRAREIERNPAPRQGAEFSIAKRHLQQADMIRLCGRLDVNTWKTMEKEHKGMTEHKERRRK